MRFSRRDFIKGLVGTGVCAGLLSSDGIQMPPEAQLLVSIPSATGAAPPTDTEHVFLVKEAMFYEKGPAGSVNCKLCSMRCKGIKDGNTGHCRVRKNVGGKLFFAHIQSGD